MALGTNLTTNEVKNSSAAEVEFLQISSTGSSRILAKSGEAPNGPHRITISHQESGVGIKKRRRSVLRVDLVGQGADTLNTPVTHSAYLVVDIPVGNVNSLNDTKDVVAELGSLAFTQGTSTFLYDGTGNGTNALLLGALST